MKLFTTRGNEILFDKSDYKKLSRYKWCESHRKGCGVTSLFFSSKTTTGSRILARYLLDCNDPKLQVDHINGNVLDNRRSNLRIVTPSQNSLNKKRYRNNKSGYKGVYLRKDTNTYSAEIKINKVRHKLGTFKTAEEASNAYQLAAKMYHGEFARDLKYQS